MCSAAVSKFGDARADRAQLTKRRGGFTSVVQAQMAELVDALVSGTSAARRGGSSPLLGTIPTWRYSEAPAALSNRFNRRGDQCAASHRSFMAGILLDGVGNAISGCGKRGVSQKNYGQCYELGIFALT